MALNWAIGKNLSKASPWVRHQLSKPVTEEGYRLVWVDIKDLFDKTDKNFALDVTDPKGGPNSIGNRVEKAKQFWSDGGFMDPANVSLDWRNHIGFGDGRHRLVAAYQLGEQYAPVMVYSEDYEKFINLIKIKPNQHIKESANKVSLPLNYYGSWFNVETLQIIPVGDYAHAKVVIQQIIPKNINQPNPYMYAYENGWIKITHQDWSYYQSLEIEGYAKFVNKAFRYIDEYMGMSKGGHIDLVKPNPKDETDFIIYKSVKYNQINYKKVINSLKQLHETSKYNQLCKAWWDCDDNIIELDPKTEHRKYLMSNPELFGNVDEDNSWDKMDEIINDGWIRTTLEGWGDNVVLFIQTNKDNTKKLRNVVSWFIKKYPHIDKVNIETPTGVWELSDNKLKTLLNTGRMVGKPVISYMDESSFVRTHPNNTPLLDEIFETQTFDDYGSWLNVNTGEMISVNNDDDDNLGHWAAMQEEPEKFGIDKQEIAGLKQYDPRVNTEYFFNKAYENNWIRLEHEDPDEAINISGFDKSMKLAWKWLKNLTITERLFIDVVNTSEWHVFNFLEDPHAIRNFKRFQKQT